MVRYFCDLCGSSAIDPKERIIIAAFKTPMKVFTIRERISEEDLILCQRCEKELTEWVERKTNEVE